MDNFLSALPKLPDSAEMRAWDKAAIDFGIPETMLMENAGAAVYAAAREKFGEFRHVCLFMGGGNNGGDAACASRHIIDGGGTAAIYSIKSLGAIGGSPAWHLDLARKNGARFFEIGSGDPLESGGFLQRFLSDNGFLPDLIVDGLLGTGFEQQLRPRLLDLIRMINQVARLLACPVVAIDIPSGLNSGTGRPSPEAIIATLTVTLAAAKPGLFLPPARPYTGEVCCRPIGLPAAIADSCPARFRMLNGECVTYRAGKITNSYKNVYGHVAVFGGAPGFQGAAHLASAAALRAGAGLVTACAPGASLAAIKSDWPEIMTCEASAGATWPQELSPAVRELVKKASSLAIGPGMGRGADAASFLSALLNMEGRPPAVLDADALFLLARHPELKLGSTDVITPHPGEAGALLGVTGTEVQADRDRALDKLCNLQPAVAVLKGAATIAGQEDHRLLCPYDIPGLAIGGAGDVLCGCIATLLGSRQYSVLSSLSRAGLGVALHAMAGLYLQKRYSGRGFTASELADALSHARCFVKSQEIPLKGLLPWPR